MMKKLKCLFMQYLSVLHCFFLNLWLWFEVRFTGLIEITFDPGHNLSRVAIFYAVTLSQKLKTMKSKHEKHEFCLH